MHKFYTWENQAKNRQSGTVEQKYYKQQKDQSELQKPTNIFKITSHPKGDINTHNKQWDPIWTNTFIIMLNRNISILLATSPSIFY